MQCQSNILALDAAPTEWLDRIPTDYVWLGVVILVGLFMVRTTWRRVARSRGYQNLSVEQKVTRQIAPKLSVIDHTNEYMATLADLSRQINGQIDTRIGRLELLLEQAGRAIERLEAATIQTAATPNAAASAPPAATPVEPDDNAACDPAPLPAIQFDYDRLSPDARAVIQLSDQGVPLIEIARQLGRPAGEVELILSLTGRKRTKP